ncbi:hypothetical protein [Candidatus Poriferisodalis sp.]|uniref:hypothetical protein n=1 Tax=Candidatus Poriferisodalis sp. TaxID=3101277 RepID=UPI003B02058E
MARIAPAPSCDASPDSRWCCAQFSGVTADYTYEVHEHGDGTARVRLTADCESTGVLWRAMSPLLRIAIRASDGKQIRLLEAMIEEG